MKLPIPQNNAVQTAFRLPLKDWEEIGKLAKENECEKSDIIRYIIAKFLSEQIEQK